MSVSTTMTIRDRMTSRLNKITQAYNKTTRAARAADAATKEVNPGASFERAEAPITRAGKKVQEFSRSQTQAAAGAEKVKSAWSGVGGYIRSAMAALGVKKAVELTLGGALNLDDMEREFQARLGNDGAGSALFNHLKEQAKTSAFGLEDLAENTASFMSVTTNPKNIDGLNAIAEKLAIFDKTGQGLKGAGFSLKEALSGDIVSLAERFNMPKNLIREFEIDEMGKNGDVEGFITQFEKLMDKMNMGDPAYQEMLKAPKRQLSIFLSNMKTGFAEAGRGALEALTPLIMKLNAWFSSNAAQSFFAGISTAISFIAQLVLFLVNIVSWIGNAVAQNWDIIAPILGFIGAIFAVWGATMIPGLITKLWAMVPPVLAQAAAWAIANWPILLIAAALVGLGILLNKLGVTFDQVTGFIGGVIYGLYAFMFNIVASIYNYWVSFVEFFANCFNHPVYSIKKLFVNLANSILNLIKSIASAIDAVFGSNLAGGIEGLQGKMQDWLGEMPEGYKVMKKLEMKSIPEYVQNGYKAGQSFGKGITDGAGGLFSGDTSAWTGYDGIDNVGTVDEVGKVKEDVSISDEDLKFMRDVAEMRYTQNFVTLTPTVSMNASISEKVDVNDVIGGIEYQLENEFALAAEGVYN